MPDVSSQIGGKMTLEPYKTTSFKVRVQYSSSCQAGEKEINNFQKCVEDEIESKIGKQLPS